MSALEVLDTALGPRLLASAYGGAHLLRFDVSSGVPAFEADQSLTLSAPAPGTRGEFDYLTLGGARLALFDNTDAATGLYGVSAAGHLTAPGAITGDLAGRGALSATVALQSGGTDYLFAANAETQRLETFALSAGALDYRTGIATGALRDITAAQAGGTDFIVATPAGIQEIRAYRVSPDGSLALSDTVGPAAGVFLQDATVLRTVDHLGKTFVFVGATGSSSITVLELNGDGQFLTTDHIVDDQGTRFQGLTELEVIAHGHHVFLVAGGSDRGFSLFSLLPGGKLFHHETVADTAETALTSLAALALTSWNGTLSVFATSETETGLTRFAAGLDDLGSVIYGGTTPETLVGTSRDDILSGGAGNDDLSGGAGRDILRDGTGTDRLTGGDGQDVFQLAFDGATDRIMDFDPSADSLDLSAFPLFHGPVQLVIKPTDWGAKITYQGNTTEIYTASGTTLSAETLRALDMTNLTRLGGTEASYGFKEVSADLEPARGGPSLETLRAVAEADLEEADAPFAPTGAASVVPETDPVAPAFSQQQRSRDLEADRPEVTSDQGLLGTPADDFLLGGAGDDWLDGAGGDDRLRGGGGSDRFVFGDASGHDRVEDFFPGTDRIDLSASLFLSAFSDLVMSQDGADTHVLLSAEASVRLSGVSTNDLSAGDFLFA
ncbi:MAG: hypothetical protein AAGF74_05630 [Pseudomonadota bacterium]